MRTLVTAASKHGSTAEIAISIARTLEELGQQTVVARPNRIHSLEGYDAVVLGSGVYGGRWLEEARAFVREHRQALEERPVWLFSSGPLGDPLKPDTDPMDVRPTAGELGARDHRLFPGRLIKGDLTFAEHAIATAFRAPEGDFRYWPDIDGWAREIAHDLKVMDEQEPIVAANAHEAALMLAGLAQD